MGACSSSIRCGFCGRRAKNANIAYDGTSVYSCDGAECRQSCRALLLLIKEKHGGDDAVPVPVSGYETEESNEMIEYEVFVDCGGMLAGDLTADDADYYGGDGIDSTEMCDIVDRGTLEKAIEHHIMPSESDKMYWPQQVPGLERDVRRLIYDQRSDNAPGYVYVFRLRGDCKNYVKIGYTKDLKTRLKAWQAKFKAFGTIELMGAFYVKRARYAERALHLLFASQRLARYLFPDKKQIYTEWFYSKEKTNTLPASAFDLASVPHNVRSFKREVEWFCLEYPIQATGNAHLICTIVNHYI